MPRSLNLVSRAVFVALLIAVFGCLPAAAQTPPQPARPGVAPAGDASTDVLFILDSSASMSRDDKRGKASDPQGLRLSAVRAFIALATARMRLGLVNLSDDYSGNDGMDKPTPLETGLVLPLTEASPQGKTQLLAAVGDMKTTHEAGLEDGFTYMSKALDVAGRVMGGSSAQQRYVVVLTDGDVTGEDPRYWWGQAKELEAKGVRFVVFRLGRREPPGLTNRELADLNANLVPGGGAARVIDRPEELLGYYLQTFAGLSRDSYVNPIGPMGAATNQPFLSVQDWMDVYEIDLLVSGAGTPVTSLVSDKLGRDVLADSRSSANDANLQIVTLTKERLGPLEGLWKIGLGQPAQDVQVVFKSRVALVPDQILQPRDADQAVVAITARDGAVAIPKKSVLARGAAGDEARPLLLGALGPDRYSGGLRPDRDGQYRVRVTGEVPGARTDLPPFLEKTFATASTDQVAVQDVGVGFERVTAERLLKAGQPLQVRASAAGGRCAPVGTALKVDASYPTPPNGIAAREAGAAAQPMGQAPGGGLLYGFVPQAPGQITFALDHAIVQCPGVELPIGVVAGGRDRGLQAFDVEVERLLKVDRESPKGLGSIPAGSDGVDVVVKYDMSSWRNERLVFGVQGQPGAVPGQPTIELAARDGQSRPLVRRGTVPVRVKFAGPSPGGAKGAFVLTVQGVDDAGGTSEIGRFDFQYDVAPGTLSARISREPTITKDGITLTLGLDPSRLVFLPPSTAQEFDVTIEGLKNARVEPKVIRAQARKEFFEQILFVQTEDVCDRTGTFGFKLGLRPLPSPNGDVLVAGAPVEVSIPLPKMDVTMSAPERIGALRPGVALPITLQSTSLCAEAMRLRVSDPIHPTRFAESGVNAPTVQLGAGAGEVRTVALAPERAAPRGETGALRLEALRVGGHPSTTYPPAQLVRYYTPLWTEEYPDEARWLFVALEIVGTCALALPRNLFNDPIAAHRDGDSSVVSGRKRFRWFVASFFIALAFASVAVYWVMARYMP